jgi:hypothetical protein
MTVSLDYDVALLLENAVHGTGRSKRDLVNEALRRALPTVVDVSSPPAPRRGRDPRPDIPPLLPEPGRVGPEGGSGASPRRADGRAPSAQPGPGQSDDDAIATALAHYFGLSAPVPRLRVVRNDR